MLVSRPFAAASVDVIAPIRSHRGVGRPAIGSMRLQNKNGRTGGLRILGVTIAAGAGGGPTPHFVSFAQAVLFRGADITLVWRPLVAMLILGSVYFFFAMSRFRRVIFGS